MRYQTDPLQREARGIGPSLANMIPGLSQNLPPKIDITGREVELDPNRLLRASKVVSKSRETPETEVYRAAGYVPPALPRKIRVAGEDISLTPEEYTDYARDVRSAEASAARRVSGQEGFASLEQDKKADRLEKATKAARERVRARWKSRIRRAGRHRQGVSR